MTEKRVLISGCSSGLGLQTSLKFASKGWQVFAIVKNKIDSSHPLSRAQNIKIIELDITNNSLVKREINKLASKVGTIDVLINNAGLGMLGLIEQCDYESIEHLFKVNVLGSISLIKEVVPIMKKEKSGIIINISSVRGVVGTPLKSIYSATKFAIQGLTESLFHELKPYNISTKSLIISSFQSSFNNNLIDVKISGLPDSIAIAKQFHEKDIKLKKEKYDEGNFLNSEYVANKIYDIINWYSPLHNFIGEHSQKIRALKETLTYEEFINEINLKYFDIG